jgi:hypothetical protein
MCGNCVSSRVAKAGRPNTTRRRAETRMLDIWEVMKAVGLLELELLILRYGCFTVGVLISDSEAQQGSRCNTCLAIQKSTSRS